MCHHPISRRHALGLGLSAAAGMLVLPSTLSALEWSPKARAAPLSDLDVALQAARWIRRSRIETKNAATWPADPRKPESVGNDLYNGMPGVILFYLELFHATGDKEWLEEARAGANELIARLPQLDAAQAAGLYEGLSGAVFVLEETHRATGEGRYRDATMQAVDMIHRQALKTTSGAAWAGPSATNDIISGSAGIGLTLLWVDQNIGHAASRTLALAAGRELMDKGIPEHGGLKWAMSDDVKVFYPNFSHGTAGVAYFLATLLKMTGDRSFMAGALSGARYLEAVADTSNGGFKVFHHEPGGEHLYYLSWCHGPAGTSRLFHRLAQITQREKWDDIVREGAKSILDSGVPEKQTPGFWNNVSQCCGNAGVGEFFIDLQRQSPNPAYMAMVRRVAANTLARATPEGDGMKWVQAENRVSPDAVVAQTGYMQGAAGVGTFFLHADGLAKGRAPQIHWPDSPAFNPCAMSQLSSTSDMSAMKGHAPAACDR